MEPRGDLEPRSAPNKINNDDDDDDDDDEMPLKDSIVQALKHLQSILDFKGWNDYPQFNNEKVSIR